MLYKVSYLTYFMMELRPENRIEFCKIVKKYKRGGWFCEEDGVKRVVLKNDFPVLIQ